jgi:hypothetical protein
MNLILSTIGTPEIVAIHGASDTGDIVALDEDLAQTERYMNYEIARGAL